MAGSINDVRGPKTQECEETYSEVNSELNSSETQTVYNPNRWSRYRALIREPFAEFLGVVILIIFGNGVNCQAVLSANPSVAPSPRGDSLSIDVGWAVGIALGVWVSGSISGGHINPAVTLALATFRGFPWKKVPIYIFAQTLGGLVGAGVIYANYIHAIDIVEGGRGVRTLATAGLFSTYPLDYVTNVSAFFDEFLGATVLIIVILAINDRNNENDENDENDEKNGPLPVGIAPLALFFLFLGIGAALGLQTGFAVNPARDLGPRLLTAMVGYGKQVFTFRNQYWIWCPIMGPILGALFGAFVYDAFLYTGEENILKRSGDFFRQRFFHGDNAV